MIFFTRKLYEGIQPESGWERRAENLWDKHCQIYRKYFQLISPMLPVSARKFSKQSLHDGVILKTRTTKGRLELLIDGHGMVDLSPHNNYKVVFSGVTDYRGPRQLEGALWCYDEIHLCSSAPFSFHVLFHKGEMEIDAVEVKLKKIQQS